MSWQPPSTFLFGASVYPEIMTRACWLRMLDHCADAGFTVFRLGESAWGNVETAPGRLEIGWLSQALDDMHRRGIRAILGTGTYVPPIWLHQQHPDIAAQLTPDGVRVHPMHRKAASLTHGAYREACGRFIASYARAIGQHPAIVGWQLDNEIDAESVIKPDYNPSAERAWTEWLRATYGTVDELNRRLGLGHWGMAVPTFEAVQQPRGPVTEGGTLLPVLSLANLRFRRDVVAAFLAQQKGVLRQNGVTQWITSNWMPVWLSELDDPALERELDVAGLNPYPGPPDRTNYHRSTMWCHDAARAAHGKGTYIITETRFTHMGSHVIADALPSREEFRMWMLQDAAFGASGILLWTGNRWHGGHWPHWGSLFDFTGEPEPEFEWLTEVSRIFSQHGPDMLNGPVRADVAVINDFDQRAALACFPHVPTSASAMPETFEILHRLGIGADGINSRRSTDSAQLEKYKMIVVPTAPVFDGAAAEPAVLEYVRAGGVLLVLPMTAVQSRDGLFVEDGLGSSLAGLTGCIATSVRRLDTAGDVDSDVVTVRWLSDGRSSPIGLSGYCELLKGLADGDVEPVARLDHPHNVLDGRIVGTRRSIGSGEVIKLGFQPADDSLAHLISRLLRSRGVECLRLLPPGVRSVPRRDGSRWVINSTARPQSISLPRPAVDRISGKRVDDEAVLEAYEVLWLTSPQGNGEWRG
jgi:beta-galactosidase